MTLVALAMMLATPSASPASDIAALREAKLVAWPGFYRRNDANGLARFLADDFVQLSHDGSTETKAQAVAWVRANKWSNSFNNFRYEIKDIVFYARNTANVFGTGSFDGKGADGAACRMQYTSANIFVRQGAGWRPRFSHTSKPACLAAPAAGAP